MIMSSLYIYETHVLSEEAHVTVECPALIPLTARYWTKKSPQLIVLFLSGLFILFLHVGHTLSVLLRLTSLWYASQLGLFTSFILWSV